MTRITLDSIRTGKRPAPDRILIYGTEGVGKSTFAAGAPNVIFIAAEDGIRTLNVASFPEPETLQDVYDALDLLIEDSSHEFKTLAIDSVDWLEPLIFAHVCGKNSWENIESPGFGKGYTIAGEEWRVLLAKLDKVRATGIEVILIGHSHVKKFCNPEGPDFDRYELAMHKQGSALVRQWCDSVLFATHEDTAVKDESTKKVKMFGTGARVLHTVRAAAYDAKSRHDIPERLELSYSAYASARDDSSAQLATLTTELDQLLPQVDETTRQKAVNYVADRSDINKVKTTVNRLKTMIQENAA